jgi:hypothetical protein
MLFISHDLRLKGAMRCASRNESKRGLPLASDCFRLVARESAEPLMFIAIDRRTIILARGLLLLLAAVACQSPAILRTARTLPEGTSDFSLSLNLTHLSARTQAAETTAGAVERAAVDHFNYPNPIPEVLYSHGVSDGVELGGRVGLGSGLFELNSKFRFLHTAQGRLHAALAPALGYRVLGLVNGPVVTLPLLITYELSPRVALSGGALGSFASYSVASGLGGDQADLGGDTLYVGGAAGLELRAGRFHLFPAVELQRSVSRTGTAAAVPEIDMLFFSFTVGIGPRPNLPPPTAAAGAPLEARPALEER